MEDHHHLITTTTTTTSILHRFLSIVVIAGISIWANYEASKGFEIVVVNTLKDTPAGRSFHLLFVADDEAIRIVLEASNFVERLLYSDHHHHHKKPIDRVTLRLADRNLTDATVPTQNPCHFIMDIDPNIMSKVHVRQAMTATVQRAMARAWLWDARGGAPVELMDGMVKYICMSAGFAPTPESGITILPESDGTCLYGDPVSVALFLRFCEGRRPGFLARLNREMQYDWHEGTVDEALGVSSQWLCAVFDSSKPPLLNGTDSTSASLLRQIM